jgi:hypothetical protein
MVAMECNIEDLWLMVPTVPASIPFKPTTYQTGIAQCFEMANHDRLWFAKTERQIGLTTVIAACIAKKIVEGPTSVLLLVPNAANYHEKKMTDQFTWQFIFKNKPELGATPARRMSAVPEGTIQIVRNGRNALQITNSRSYDLVVIDEARLGEFKVFSQLTWLRAVLKPNASVFIFGA